MLFAILLILGILAIWFLPQFASDFGTGGMQWPFFGRQRMSAREHILYRRLSIMYPKHLIFTHMELSHLADVQRSLPQVVADFVLCRRDFTIVAVIELDECNADAAQGWESEGARVGGIATGQDRQRPHSLAGRATANPRGKDGSPPARGGATGRLKRRGNRYRIGP